MKLLSVIIMGPYFIKIEMPFFWGQIACNPSIVIINAVENFLSMIIFLYKLSRQKI